MVLDEAKAAMIIVSLLLHTSVPPACQYFPPLLPASVQQVLRMAELMPEHLVFCTSFRMCPVSIATVSCRITPHQVARAGFDIEAF